VLLKMPVHRWKSRLRLSSKAPTKRPSYSPGKVHNGDYEFSFHFTRGSSLEQESVLTLAFVRPQMGKELTLQYPSFLESIRSMDKVLQGLNCPPSWSIEGNSAHLFCSVLLMMTF
jgi:hypothetical protein